MNAFVTYLAANDYVVTNNAAHDTELHLFSAVILTNLILATTASFCGFFLGLLAPYGTESKQTSKIPEWWWGPKMSAKNGWYLMEVPALVVAILTVVLFDHHDYLHAPVHCQLAVGMFLCHYVNRAIIYPSKRNNNASMERCATFVLGAVFNSGNAYAVIRYLTKFGRHTSLDSLSTFHVIASVLIFFIGVAVNMVRFLFFVFCFLFCVTDNFSSSSSCCSSIDIHFFSFAKFYVLWHFFFFLCVYVDSPKHNFFSLSLSLFFFFRLLTNTY